MGLIDRFREIAEERGYYKRVKPEVDNGNGYDEGNDDSIKGYTAYPPEKDYRNDDLQLPPLSSRPSKPTVTPAFGSARANSSKSAHIVDISANIKMQVVISNPESVNDCGALCDYVKANKIVIVNLDKAEHGTAQRIVDFLSAVAYSLEGDIQPVSSRTFVVAPPGVDISGNLKEELKATGLMFSLNAAH